MFLVWRNLRRDQRMFWVLDFVLLHLDHQYEGHLCDCNTHFKPVYQCPSKDVLENQIHNGLVKYTLCCVFFPSSSLDYNLVEAGKCTSCLHAKRPN